MKKLLLLLAGLVPAFAQVPISSTTLSAALAGGLPGGNATTQVCLASATNVVLPSLTATGGVLGSILLVDAEAMQVQAATTSSTCFNVRRGIIPNLFSNGATAHANGARVYVLGPTVSTGDPSRPIATTAFLSQRGYQPSPVIGTPAVNGVATASVTDVNGTIFFSAIQTDFSIISNGACVLNGATVTTDKHVMGIWDKAGTLLANTALAGVADSGASVYQCQSWTAPVALPGPAQYFVGVQANGTTDNIQMYATGGASGNFATGSQTGTFGTLPALVITTTFTASKGPLFFLQ